MKIPPQAKRVFKGIIFDVYQWEQEMFDGSKETFEMLKRAGTVIVLATQSDKISILHESQPAKPDFYSLPGGRIDEGEEPLAAAKRELLEEAGLESSDWELFKIYEPYTKMDWQIHCFMARNCQKVAEPNLDAGEKISVEVMGFDKFLEIIQNDKFHEKELIIEILKMMQDPKRLGRFRKRLFSTNEQELRDWIHKFIERYRSDLESLAKK